jgi:hypothetical protein
MPFSKLGNFPIIDDFPLYRILVGKSEGKRTLETPRRK